MKNKMHFGFLSPQKYMKSAIEKIQEEYCIFPIESVDYTEKEIDKIVKFCKQHNIQSVAGYAQKDAFAHILINEKLGNIVPSKIAFFYAMNKYLMRTLEENPFFFVAVNPLTETNEEILHKIPDNEWPFILKNTSLSLGKGIYKIHNKENLFMILDEYRKNTKLQKKCISDYQSYLKTIPSEQIPQVIPPFIAEHLVDLNTTIEYCYEGYITPDGKIIHYGFTEEVYFGNHQALGYITPPISIDTAMIDKIEIWVNKYMQKFVNLGYINQFFNLEFWILPNGSIQLTEINPRAAHSFHYNYYYTYGNNLYLDNLLLASGQSLGEPTPWERWKVGQDNKYTLIVLITTKQAGKVSEILDYEYVNFLETKEKILIRHNRQPTDIIREDDITTAGVMLLQIWISAELKNNIIKKEKELRKKIYKEKPLSSDVDYPEYWREK